MCPTFKSTGTVVRFVLNHAPNDFSCGFLTSTISAEQVLKQDWDHKKQRLHPQVHGDQLPKRKQ